MGVKVMAFSTVQISLVIGHASVHMDTARLYSMTESSVQVCNTSHVKVIQIICTVCIYLVQKPIWQLF